MTEAQLLASIKTQFTFRVSYPTSPKHSVLIEDVSDALSLTGTQTIKYLYKITSPSGTVIYKNTGFDTDTYTTSDKLYSAVSNLPLTTIGEPEAGAYKIIIKAQFADSAFPLTDFTTSKTTITKELCMCDSKTIAIDLTYDVNASTFTSTDATDYSGSLDFYSLARTHTIVPPVASGLTNLVGSSTSLIFTGIWTGVWQSLIQSYVSYRGYNDNDSTYSYFTYYCVGDDDEKVVSDSILCKMYCGLKSLELKVAQSVGKAKDDYEKKLNAGTNEMFLASQSSGCDDSEKLQYFSDRFYEVTGLDPNCDCCGNSETSAPIVNSSSSLGFSVGTVTTGTAAVTISGSYPNYVLNFVIPAGGGASTISPESYIQANTTINASDTNLKLYYTGTAGHYAIKEENQRFKEVYPNGTVLSLLVDAERFDTAELCPTFNAGYTGSVKIRKLYSGQFQIKGYFTFRADTFADQAVFQIPLAACPAESALDTRVKCLVKHFHSATNSTTPQLASGDVFVGIKKALGQTQFSLTVQIPTVPLPSNPSYMYIDDILEFTENISIV